MVNAPGRIAWVKRPPRCHRTSAKHVDGHQNIKLGCVILLNGFPEVGKLAIACAMQAKLPKDTTRLIDNHILIDPAQAVSPGRGVAQKNLREHIRRGTFNALKEEFESAANLSVIITGCLADNEEDTAVFAEHV